MKILEKAKFVVRIPKELNEKLAEISKQQGIAKNALIVQALWKVPKEYKEVI